MNQASILIVDDEQAIVHLLKTVFQKEGFTSIHTASSGEQALQMCRQTTYDIIILDIMMGGQSGIEIFPFLRQLTDAPILFLSAKSTDFDKLTGFAVGGDDYITKPFNPLEVVARVKAQLRRSKMTTLTPQSAPEVLDFGRFQVYPDAGELIVEGEPVACPTLVFQLLVFLARHPNRIFTKSELYERVWGETAMGEDNTVMVHIHRIRERIEKVPNKPEYLINVRGLGYKLVKSGGHHVD